MRWGRILFLSSTLVVALAAVAVVPFGAKAAPLAIFAVLGYATIILRGVLNPRLAMFAPTLVRLTGQRREIALTFDDGPDATTTPMVLATLARFHAKATFFVLGEKVRSAPDVVRAIADAGHTIGIHGDRHDRLLSLRHPKHIATELERAQNAVARITGETPRLFRPPIGHISPRTAAAAKRLGLVLVAWSVRGRDGLASARPDHVQRRVVQGLCPGAIVLLHDAAEQGNRVPAGVTALSAILESAARANLACVPIPSPK